MYRSYKFSVLCIYLTHVASPSFAQATRQLPLEAEAPVETEAPDSKVQPSQGTKIALPLAKTAHKSAMELLHLFFVSKPIAVPIYIPFLQHIGIKLNWTGLAWGLLAKRPYYEGGIDFHFRGNIQLAADIGYGYAKAKSRAYNFTKGSYGIGGVRYVMHPNLITNAYVGVAYGWSYFSLFTSNKLSRSPMAHWTKFILGSECRLFKSIAKLYGGMYIGIAYLFNDLKHKSNKGVDYVIPGYGKHISNPHWSLDCYLKWTITFLEKKVIVWHNK